MEKTERGWTSSVQLHVVIEADGKSMCVPLFVNSANSEQLGTTNALPALGLSISIEQMDCERGWRLGEQRYVSHELATWSQCVCVCV